MPYTAATPLRRPGHANEDGLDRHLAPGKGVIGLPDCTPTPLRLSFAT